MGFIPKKYSKSTLCFYALSKSLDWLKNFTKQQYLGIVHIKPKQREIMTIKVLVADDHELVRMGLVHMLNASEDIVVVGEAECGSSAIAAAKATNPDVVLLDVNMPNLNGIEASKKILSQANCKILAVSSHAKEPYPSMLIKAGVQGYITKGTPFADMVLAIKKIAQGERYFCAEVAEVLAQVLLCESASPFDVLSERERQVAMMVADCQSIGEIADKLFVSPKTVNTYRYRIFEKLGVDSDVKLTHLAIRHGLIEP